MQALGSSLFVFPPHSLRCFGRVFSLPTVIIASSDTVYCGFIKIRANRRRIYRASEASAITGALLSPAIGPLLSASAKTNNPLLRDSLGA